MEICEKFYTDIDDKEVLLRKAKRVRRIRGIRKRQELKDSIKKFAIRYLKKRFFNDTSEDIFIVTYPLNGSGIFEIYSFDELLQKYYKAYDKSLKVVGISESRSGAYGLVERIVNDAFSDCEDNPDEDYALDVKGRIYSVFS